MFIVIETPGFSMKLAAAYRELIGFRTSGNAQATAQCIPVVNTLSYCPPSLFASVPSHVYSRTPCAQTVRLCLMCDFLNNSSGGCNNIIAMQ